MKPFEHIGMGLVVLAALAACSQPLEEEPLPPGVEEIPVTTKSKEALAKFRKGERFRDVGRVKQANPIFENATGKDPRFSYAYLNAAYTAASVREFNDHLKLAILYGKDKSEGERLLIEIAQTYRNNDAEKRVELAEALVAAYPRSRRAWLDHAEVHFALDQRQAGRESLARALELDPSFMATNVAIFRSYLLSEPRDLARAEQAMQKCLEIAPEEGKLYENLADVYRAMNKLEEARELYAQATAKDPQLAVAYVKKGHTNSYLGNFEEARADYDTAIEGARDQSQLEYASYRAFAHLHAGDFGATLDELAPLLEEVDQIGLPRDQIVAARLFILSNLAAIQLHHGLLDEAAGTIADLAAANRSLAKQADASHVFREREATILLWESRLAARQGDYEIARSKAEEHLRLLEGSSEPRPDEGYQRLLGLIELLQGHHQLAVERLLKADLHDVYVKYQMAQAQEGAGNVEEAKRLFREVATSNFNSVGFALVRRDAMERAS